MQVISLDPGGTTGYVVWKYNAWTSGALGPADHHWQLYQFLTEQSGGGSITIVCERFENRGNDFAKLMSNEYVGVVKAWYQSHYLYCNLVMQGSSQAKDWATDNKLEILGLAKHKTKHAKDAMRHLVYYVCNSKNMRHHPQHNKFMQKLREGLT
jgi:hypothetical protein